MNWSQSRLLLLVSLLLVVSAAVFAVGSVVEHRQTGESASETSRAHSDEGSAAGESASEPGAENAEGGEAAAPSEHRDNSEDIAGLDPESWPAVTAAIAASLLLAAGIYWRRSRRWLLAAAAFGILFAAGDIRELIHQLDESRASVAAIAAVLIALHLLVTLSAAATLRWSRSR